jgi:hypothetical protein
MTEPTIVTFELLDALAERLESLGAPIAQHWRPGLTDAEIDGLMEPTGLSLPEELRRWFAWHDGVDGPPWPAGEPTIGRVWRPWTLAGALEHRTIINASQRVLEGQVPAALLREMWSAYWLPIFDTGHPSFTLASGLKEPGEVGYAPVHLADWEDGAARRAILPSLGALIEFWIGVADRGLWRVGGNGYFEELPLAERERLPLGSLI